MEGLTFAVVAKSTDTHDLAAGFCRRLRERTGLSVFPRVLTSYSDVPRQLASARIDLAWAPPLVAMELEESRVAKLLAVVTRPFSAGYHSALFARADSGLRSIERLSASTVAWVSPKSASGYFVPRWHLRSQGIALPQAFGRELFFPNHEAVAQAVLSGEAEVGATHVVLDPVNGRLASAPWRQLNQSDQDIRVLLLVGPIPADVIAARIGLSTEAQRQLTAALLALRADDPGVSSLFDATSFEPVPEGHLALLRRLSRYASDRSRGT